MLLNATFNGSTVGGYVAALFEVYIGLILLYILISLALSFGFRPPYSRWFDALMTFLRETCEPYIGLFRRFIHPIGGIDLSPILAIIVLGILEQVVVGALGG